MNIFIGEISEIVPKVNASTSNQIVDQLFTEDSSTQGIVVTENEVPIALITRTSFYQKLGTLYGYNLYMGRTVRLLMNSNILCVDYYQSITEVSERAMKRKEEQLYDYIIVTKDGYYHGVVSIRTLLITLAKVQSKIATYMNPLTGLPGNQIINEKLHEALKETVFSVLYIDLDHFKTYNDIYGFSKGDQMIQETAALLKHHLNGTSDFLGHIGGDDFLAILYTHSYQSVCEQIIQDFDKLILHFYTEEHFSQGFITAENRLGKVEKIPLVAISIAVISRQNKQYHSVEEIVANATKIKKYCKRVQNSCYLDDSLCIRH
ncbi:GGDEF domain-containing protein [Metabacillus niabensis]|uniref:GGDEF domain-containing protein n=1 Tax=Metabacillus niabensis TaxID=324854 RepID=UPI0039A3177A